MHCPKCGSDSKSGRKFCANCGNPLAIRCPRCTAENEPSSKFCEDCGAALIGNLPSSTAHNTPQPVAEISTIALPATNAATIPVSATGERRHLTVLFCDLVGSTEIAAQLDPEEWREVVATYHRIAAEVITRYGGNVAKYLGDGVMAFFGYPEAHDNDAERAARAGLEMIEAISQLGGHAGRPKLTARVGIDSGAVVVGVGAGKETDVFGEAPNIAARVQAAAEHGTVLITDAVHRLVSGLFAVEDRGRQSLRGIERHLQLYQLVRPSRVRGRLEAAAATRGLTPFVGREDELRSLMTRWERVLEGEGQVVLIIGEAGIGKSRLVKRFQEEIAGRPHKWASAAAAPFYQNTPFYAVADLQRELLAAPANESSEELLERLESSLVMAACAPAEAIPLIAPILKLPTSDKYQPSSLAPEQQRRRLLAILVDWLVGFAQMQPLVLEIEDLHWADPSTLDLIQLLGEQGTVTPAMLVCTARPDFRPQWPLRAHHTQVTLNRLSARHTRTMVEQVAARKALTDETIAAVIERTGGVPLFVEELTRVVLESSSEKLSDREIPVTLQDSLMARLDRLGPAKEVIQVCAVIGPEFSYELLHLIHPISEAELQTSLGKLADAELLHVRGIAPDATYQFKHALIRDAAYDALLKSRRRELHRLVATKISQELPALKAERPEMLARHWMEAGEIQLAIDEWSRAGRASEARNAFKEALESYQQAVALCSRLAKTDEGYQGELALRQAVVRLLWVTKGYATTETVAAADSAAAVAKESGALAQLVLSLVLRGFTTMFSGDLAGASALADQALELALSEGSSTSLGSVHNLKMQTCCFRGDLNDAEEHFATGLPFFGDSNLKQLPGTAQTAVFGVASWNAWMLGRIGLARERLLQMRGMVNLSNPFEESVCCIFSTLLHIYFQDYEAAKTVAERALELSERYQFHQTRGTARCALGHTRAQLGHVAEGTALIRQGLSGLVQTGVHLLRAQLILFLAAAQDREGLTRDALTSIEQAVEVGREERFLQPEILRLRGSVRFKEGKVELAEADFHEALTFARSMNAKSWELRATLSLARLLVKQDRRAEARSIVAEIYNWFTEGFDTADLKNAKALLEELSNSP